MNKEKSKCCGATKGERPYYGEKGVKTIFQFCTSCGQKFYPTMNNTLKQLQEKGEEELKKEWKETFGKEANINPKSVLHDSFDWWIDKLNQQTTLAYNTCKADMLDTVLKEIEGQCVDEDNLNSSYVLGFNQCLDTLKNKLLANKE